MDETEAYARARARVRQLKAFYLHARARYHNGGDDWWVLWPALGWGIAVAIHAMVILVGGVDRFDNWEERKIEDMVRREKERSGV